MTGLSPQVLAELIAELGPRWQAHQDARLADRPRQRAVGAGASYRLILINGCRLELLHWLGRSRRTRRCLSTAGLRDRAPERTNDMRMNWHRGLDRAAAVQAALSGREMAARELHQPARAAA